MIIKLKLTIDIPEWFMSDSPDETNRSLLLNPKNLALMEYEELGDAIGEIVKVEIL